MNRRVVAVVGLVLMLVLLSSWGLATQDANRSVMNKITTYQDTHPRNWLDTGLGFVTGAGLVLIVICAVSIYESERFEKQRKGGGSSSGGNLVQMPMSRKKLYFGDTWKVPPDGRVHREFVTT